MGALTNKVAVVTGASKGFGGGIAVAFGAAGAAVVVNYASDAQGAGRAVNQQWRPKAGLRRPTLGADGTRAADVDLRRLP
jgi:3-oxoacyl-[acyl-carrier protein] reductase